MIERDELRRLMELEGYDPETIDKVIEFYYGLGVSLDQLTALLDLLRAELSRAAHDLVELWEAVQGGLVVPPKVKPPRPPRCIGSKSMTAQRAQRPVRVARSSCRKVRR